ncbi:hypothetical protein [Psychroflexus sp. MES1-P1E]|uniref:hypothetical protein n=1 Tax=Psychroflexus sp. MES1-P1E TaxID=2058320 RepID=UPI002155C791|nr:hypothetical protein [Psychroflexus sp. MES1-P1E]
MTTFLLLTVVIFAMMNLSFGWIFYATCLGQIALIYSVYRVLRKDYASDKTFSDLYEDRPDLGE